MAKKIIKAQMKQRQDTKANWAAVNPVLLDGELGMVSDDHNLYKVGDGRTAWNDLPFRGFDGTLAQELGTSPNAAISQKAVTEKLTELSKETIGLEELKFSADIVANAVSGFQIFQSLEEGQKYIFRSTTACNFEYYTKDGGYKHLFDTETEITFICPSDYKKGENQIVVNTEAKEGEFKIFRVYDGAIKSLSEHLQEVDELSAQNAKALRSKQNVISDLDAIRSGAKLGATALQEHQDISHLAVKSEIERQFSELSKDVADVEAEVLGAMQSIFSASLEYVLAPFTIFPKLEKGKTYVWKSTIPCNVEYYTADGGYVHLFDNQTEIEFVCPTDYDESKDQYIVNPEGKAGSATIAIRTTGLKNEILAFDAKVSELEKTTNRLGISLNQQSQEFESLATQVNTLGDEIAEFSSQVDSLGDEIESINKEITGADEVKFQHSVQYTSEPVSLFQKLEKGKTYVWKSTIPCNVEYYTADGGYVHLFDNQTEIEFVCPTDYDESKDQYIFSPTGGKGTASVRYNVGGILKDIDILEKNIAAINDDIDNLREGVGSAQGETINIKVGTDYTRIAGLIRNDGTIDTSATSFWYSTPIKVQVGDILHIVKLYNNSSDGEVWETDSENSYHKMLVKSENGVRDIVYVVNRPMYVNLNYLMGDTNYQVSIRRGGVDSRREEAISSSIKKNRDAMPTFIPNTIPSVINNAAYVDDLAAAVNARFERQKMLQEVAAYKRKGIAPLKSGYCGYDDRGGSIVHNTISWEIFDNGILYISGYGKMYDYVKGVSQGFNAAELDAMAEENPYMWYYYLVKDGVTYSEYDDNHNVMYTYPAPFAHRVYNSADGERVDADTGRYVGYASPWYSYRSEIDFVEYCTPAHYNEFNPNHIYYDRICIDEELAYGGITRIGDWAFYRATCDSLVLPSRLTEIGRWSVRYSPVLRTLVMDNLITILEDHAISRMENMNHLILSNAVKSVAFYGLAQNPRLRRVELLALTHIEESAIYGCNCIDTIVLGDGIDKIPNFNFVITPYVRHLHIPNGVTYVGVNTFSYMQLDELHLPSSINNLPTQVNNRAFEGSTANSVFINNTYVQTLLNQLPILYDAAYLFIKEDVEVNSYILSNYDCTGIHNGYKRFVKRPAL